MINQVFLMTYDQWQVWEGGLVKVTGLVGFVQEREQSSLVSVGFEPATFRLINCTGNQTPLPRPKLTKQFFSRL